MSEILIVDKYHAFPLMSKLSSILQKAEESQIPTPHKQVQIEALISGGAKFREEARRHFTLLQPLDFIPCLPVSAVCVAQTLHSTGVLDKVSSVDKIYHQEHSGTGKPSRCSQVKKQLHEWALRASLWRCWVFWFCDAFYVEVYETNLVYCSLVAVHLHLAFVLACIWNTFLHCFMPTSYPAGEV